MIQSMTGYGKASGVYQDRMINVEIRALNGKSTDFRIKCPTKYAARELWIRKKVLNVLERGKFDMTISVDGDVGEEYTLDEKLFRSYYNKLKSLSVELEADDTDYFAAIVRIPNVIRTTLEDLSGAEWDFCAGLIDKALQKITDYRISEGRALEADISVHLRSIMLNLVQVSTHELARIEAIKTKLSGNLKNLVEEQKIDQNRFEQELIYYLERLDINEEKIRLEQNCTYFKQLLDDENMHDKGKKLIFISQEIGREINTMGAKAQYAPIQQLVVNMKDDLERIKEQLLNVL
jgi:uncharacterized protein (TIGR00255 family)